MDKHRLGKMASGAVSAAAEALLRHEDWNFSAVNIHASSAADRVLSQVIEERLGPSGLPILDEERTRDAPSDSEQGLRWVVDPLDGTINALAGSPDVAISVALCDAQGQTHLAAVQLPAHGLELESKKGGGLRVNGKLWNSIPNDRPTPIIAYGVGDEGSGGFARTRQFLDYCLSHGVVTRQAGSAVLDIARVALGVWDAYFQEGLYEWDFASARLFVEETGGTFVAFPQPGEPTEKGRRYRVCAIRGGASISDELTALIAGN